MDAAGATVKGSEVDYNGQPAGYAGDPGETITYVDAHDNETLFDALQFKLPRDTLDGGSRAHEHDRAGHHRAGAEPVVLARRDRPAALEVAGPQQLQLGRLVQPDRLVGARRRRSAPACPPETDNAAKWDFMRPLLADAKLKPGAGDLAAARARAAELLRIRFSSPLFRLGSARLIQERVSFPRGGPGQTPGVIVMAIAGRSPGRASSSSSTPSPAAAAEAVPSLVGRGYALHPVQAGGGDPVVRQASYDRAHRHVQGPGAHRGGVRGAVVRTLRAHS